MSSDHVAGAAGPAGEHPAVDLAAVLRRELPGLRDECGSALRSASFGVLFLAAAGGCAVLAAGAASTVLLQSLDPVLPRRRAAARRTAGYVSSAVALGSLGNQLLRTAGGTSERVASEIRAAAAATAGTVVGAGGSAVRRAVSGRR